MCVVRGLCLIAPRENDKAGHEARLSSDDAIAWRLRADSASALEPAQAPADAFTSGGDTGWLG
jgi:hypothetical protein